MIKKGTQPSLSALPAKTAMALVAVASLCAGPVSADTIFGLHAGASLWQPDGNGTIGPSDNSFDLAGEFDGGDSDSTSMYIAVEHFVPLIPNVMLRSTPVNWSGQSDEVNGTLLGTFNFVGEASAVLDLDMTDVTLYYELLDNWVTVDLGLTARRFDGVVEVTEESITGNTEQDEISETVPMIYGHLRFDLPFSGLSVGVRGNGIGADDIELLDLEAYVHLEVDLIPTLDFGLQGGIRRLSLDIDDVEDWNSDATLEGAFIGLTAHF